MKSESSFQDTFTLCLCVAHPNSTANSDKFELETSEVQIKITVGDIELYAMLENTATIQAM